jgi:UDP-glucose 4-epimerase
MTGAGRRALVVGGAGFVGAAAVRELLAEGWRVAVMDPAPRAVPAGAEALAGSIEDAASIRAALEASKPDAIACFAAYGGSGGGLSRAAEAEADRAFAVNVLGFRRLLVEVAAAGIKRVVWTSSTVVLGAAVSEARVDEDAPRLPLGTYALTKVLAEDVAEFMRRVHGLEITGLRIPLMLGPGLWYDGAASWVKRLVDQEPEIAAPGIPFDAMHAADLGRLVAQLLAGARRASRLSRRGLHHRCGIPRARHGPDRPRLRAAAADRGAAGSLPPGRRGAAGARHRLRDPP